MNGLVSIVNQATRHAHGLDSSSPISHREGKRALITTLAFAETVAKRVEEEAESMRATTLLALEKLGLAVDLLERIGLMECRLAPKRCDSEALCVPCTAKVTLKEIHGKVIQQNAPEKIVGACEAQAPTPGA